MSRKDYKLIASVIAAAFDHERLRNSNHSPTIITLMIREVEGYKAELCRQFVEKLKADNPNFDKDVFYDACGIPLAK